MKKLMVIAIVVALSLTAAMAMAQSNTSITVQALVDNTCRFITPTTPVDFGTYDPTDPTANTAGQGAVTFRCTKNTSYATYITRTNTMAGTGANTDTLSYELYSDSGRTSVYPADAASGIAGTAATNAPITEDIYGTITALQDVRADTYTETVTFTVNY